MKTGHLRFLKHHHTYPEFPFKNPPRLKKHPETLALLSNWESMTIQDIQ